MTNQYQKLVNTGLTKKIAKQLGLPRPAVLRRHAAGAPLVPGPVVVLGDGASAQPTADLLLGWGLDVLRHLPPGRMVGAVVVAYDDVARPGDLADVALNLGPAVKSLVPGGRVVSISRPAGDGKDPELAAARQGVDGLMRSLGRELRGGATANGLLLAEGVDMGAPSAQAALRFLLSGRSAYVDGQFLEVSDGRGKLPEDWEKPLAGKVAVVTGAARGIGASIAATLARDGATVVAVDVPAAGSALARVANDVRGTALQLDVTRADAGHLIIEHATQRHGRLDIVVHNAGITRDKLLANMDEGRWKSVIAVNTESQLRMNQAFLAAGLPGLRVVSLASTSGIAGNRGQTNYAASKGGVMGMVRASSAAFADIDGGINAVAPGFIETEMTARVPVATRAVARMVMPSLMQGGLPVDVAEAISFLASDAAAGVNGETLRVCGQSLIGR
ncbi:3-oxoacyl-ACP reductase [Zhihengliuella salsuginis]|uniref:3-oxoacyl-ACP reductase n=1 Tax=Zhihengliuella salsuginis TaxID=578222 RepID=A0ABQ3GDR9_9MICC|nr:3-oxoacyl-ACP reductase [Zhihengliuella salsuginis]GHD01695.1 3-oxoacyl-ACP reductase [Zhihengliuella salsuginis]